MNAPAGTRQVRTFCPMCISRCGATATILDGEFVALGPDPEHPTGRAVCVKGKAAPEILRHSERLLYPLRRTNSKTASDPGWEQITWAEALSRIADRLLAIKQDSGAESVVFGAASGSTAATSDALEWITRLRRAFGSPNFLGYMELCGWGRAGASVYTFGVPVPSVYLPDIEHTGCVLFWGYNPSVARLSHATATVDALARGAKLIVVDPRRVGLASKADHWLRVRPGTDAALALAMIHVMIERGWYDVDFARRWTNAPLLVRADDRRFLRAADLDPAGAQEHLVAWDTRHARPATYAPSQRAYDAVEDDLALEGTYIVNGVECRPVFALLAERCAEMAPTAEDITGVPAADLEAAARTLWESRPVAYYQWSGLEQHSGTTQAVRAINILYALTGCLDAPGGNVGFTLVPANPIDGFDLLSAEQRAKAIGVEQRPLGPARFEHVTGEDFYAAALDGTPYRAWALVNFGANLVMAHGDTARGRAALRSLDFFVHADLFLNPTAELADIVLPVTTPFEADGLRIGFEGGQDAAARVQLRRPLVAPRGEARSDLQIVFALATELGLGDRFWNGDIAAAFGHQLAPSGVSVAQLLEAPGGVAVPVQTVHRKHEIVDNDTSRGFRTRSGTVELYSEVFLAHGYPPLPEFSEPAISPRSRPDLAARFPLVLSCAKSLRFCETQHRQIVSLRRGEPDPCVEMHPETAAARDIRQGDWVRISTPNGDVRARAKYNHSLDPDVVFAQHGWWQACDELGLPAYPVDGPHTANLNLVLRQGPSDPVSGSSPLRASVCNLSRFDDD